MANRRLLLKRQKAVRNIRKITRTMQLIATARFQAAFARATASKPYSEKLAELVGNLSDVAANIKHPLLDQPAEDSVSRNVIISSDRGLCGGYNINVLRTAISHLDAQADKGTKTEVHMVGKKGNNYFKFLGREINESTLTIGDAPKFEDVATIADDLMDRFTRGEITSVNVGYMRFHSAGRQRPEIMRLLPLTQDETPGDSAPSGTRRDYEFSPEPKALLDELLPATVRVRLYQCFLDACVSEQVARMVAMKAATDAAGDMITALTRQYNRARQTHITMELLDIVGGANALA